MRHGWMALALSAFCLLGKGVLVTGLDDLYLEEQQSGDHSVLNNDDDFNSGSGSGFLESDDEDEQINEKTLNIKPIQHSTQTSSPRLETTSFASPDIWVASTHEGQQVTEEKPQDSDLATSTSMSPQLGSDSDKQNELQSEYLTEVLAAVIAGGVIGFLFAIFLILLLVYRMRKKDEGSYDLGERKLPNTTYQKAPAKEFYA